MGRTAGAAALGFVLGCAVTYFLARRKAKEREGGGGAGQRRWITGLRGTPRNPDTDSSLTSIVKGSAFARQILAEHGLAEHVGFLSAVMRELWPYIDKAAAAMVKEMMEPMFADMLPGPLKTLKFTKLDLGTVPVELDNVLVHKRSNDDKLVQFDLDIVWNGDCDIQMQTNFGLTFGVKSVKLSGRMTFLLCPLTNVLPVVSAIQYAFINPPDLELDFTGLAQVADFAVVDKTIRKMIQDVMANMVVLPNRMLYKMDLTSNCLQTYQPPVGVVRVTVVGGRDFNVQRGLVSDDVPDVYLQVAVGAGETWRTSTEWNSTQPQWNEVKDFVLSEYDQAIKIHAWDEDKMPLDPDDELGEVEITVGDLLVAGGTAEVELLDCKTGAGTGAFLKLACDIVALRKDNLASFESGSRHSDPNHLVGALSILIPKAFGIPKREEAATFVKVVFGKKEFFSAVIVDYPGIDGLNPPYDAAFMIPLTADMVGSAHSPNAKIDVHLYQKDVILGSTSVTLASVASSPDQTLNEKRFIGDGGISLELQLMMYGVDVSVFDLPSARQLTVDEKITTQSVASTGQMGEVKITAVGGRGFKIQKKLFAKDHIPDVYLKIKYGPNKQKWKTSVAKDQVTPKWKDEHAFFTMTDETDLVVIDAYDKDGGTTDPDDYLGSAQVQVGDLFITAAKAVELPLVKTKGRGRGKKTGAYITIDCDVV